MPVQLSKWQSSINISLLSAMAIPQRLNQQMPHLLHSCYSYYSERDPSSVYFVFIPVIFLSKFYNVQKSGNKDPRSLKMPSIPLTSQSDIPIKFVHRKQKSHTYNPNFEEYIKKLHHVPSFLCTTLGCWKFYRMLYCALDQILTLKFYS